MNKSSLAPVVDVESDKCVNCYACIAACPVKYCMNATGDAVTINHDLCIGCGSCIAACTHGARVRVDDAARFFEALRRKENVVAIAAPAVVASLPERYLHLNGYLLSLGVSAVFDVSFGAELTVASYLDHIRANAPKLVIAQPCPALVSYMEVYRPELLPHIAPADSPMVHTMKMIREYFPQYRGYRFVVLSPCLAKRREFDDVGIGDFNVTLASIQDHLTRQNIDLSAFPAVEYANPPAERAVLFSTPGGLLRTAEREVPGIGSRARKIEGPNHIYPYLDKLDASLRTGVNPLLVDCLNCDLGCNGGPGTLNGKKSPDELERPIEIRRAHMEQRYASRTRLGGKRRLKRVIGRYWKSGLYVRTYRDRSAAYHMQEPSNQQAQQIYRSMEKYSEADFYDCTSCGYNSCKAMMKAIFNGLNKRENCHHYDLKRLDDEKARIARFNQALDSQISEQYVLLEKIFGMVQDLNVKIAGQSASVEQSSAAIQQMIASIDSISQISRRRQASVDQLVDHASKGRESMDETISSVDGIAKSVGDIAEMIEIIEGVASNTNLLSMNAAIEAAHAGETGKGFAVVADEIRRLSEATHENSRNIARTLGGIIEGIARTSQRSEQTAGAIGAMAGEIGGFADTMTQLINTFGELSAGSGQITAALVDLRTLSVDVRETYGELMDTAQRLREGMTQLSEFSTRNLSAIL